MLYDRDGTEIRHVILIMDFYDWISVVGICSGWDTEEKGPHSLKGGKKYK